MFLIMKTEKKARGWAWRLPMLPSPAQRRLRTGSRGFDPDELKAIASTPASRIRMAPRPPPFQGGLLDRLHAS